MAKKVLVGMSGGMDSEYCAKRLIEEGYEVVGAYFSFCEFSDPAPAERCAEKLGIKLIVKDEREEFAEKVIAPFIAEYSNGRTPNPCVLCNPLMKFKCLADTADENGIEYIATGHYAKIEQKEGRPRLFSAKDELKDQSYFLWGLGREVLSRTIFPLADVVKTDVRRETGENKKESMDVCFIPDNDTQKFVSERTVGKKGKVVSTDGRILGEHSGIANYTVGQRRGLGIAVGERAYVIDIKKDENEVVLGSSKDMETKGLFIKNLNFVSRSKDEIPTSGLSFKSRSRMKKSPCRVEFFEDGAIVVGDLCNRRTAPGQSVVIYLGDELLFGGTVEKNLC